MYHGTVKWFNETLQEGQKVTYDVEPDPKNADKLRAVNVVAA